ncbi:unnamed protein product [Moneuplotes crassus]|uniref:Uncharacterized protein n=1 Tax=Euplotes crassus TaxID=5936 RepID=A0AAD1XL84_EUPCR|nr:unnamed protein product [Moneuplotes crassus]
MNLPCYLNLFCAKSLRHLYLIALLFLLFFCRYLSTFFLRSLSERPPILLSCFAHTTSFSKLSFLVAFIVEELCFPNLISDCFSDLCFIIIWYLAQYNDWFMPKELILFKFHLDNKLKFVSGLKAFGLITFLVFPINGARLIISDLSQDPPISV